MLHQETNTFPGASKPNLGSLILSYKRISVLFPTISNDSALWWTQFIWGVTAEFNSLSIQQVSSQEEKKKKYWDGVKWLSHPHDSETITADSISIVNRLNNKEEVQTHARP